MCSYSRIGHFKSTFCINTSSGFVVVSVSRARGTHCTGGAHGAGARFPRERVRHSVRGALPFANPRVIVPISDPSLIRRGDLFSHRCDTGTLTGLSSIFPFLLFLPSFSPRRTSWRHFEVPSSPSSRRTARTTGSSSSRCSCARRSSCTATTSRLGTFLFIYLRMGNCTDDVVFYLLISSQGE